MRISLRFISYVLVTVILVGGCVHQLGNVFFNNDGINNLRYGISTEFPDAGLLKLREATVNVCRTKYSDNPDRLNQCVNYQSVIETNYPFNHPFYSYFGRSLVDLKQGENFLLAVYRALLSSALFQAIAAAALICLILSQVPIVPMLVISGSLCLGILSTWSRKSDWLGQVDLFTAISWMTPAMLAAIFGVTWSLLFLLRNREKPASTTAIWFLAAIVAGLYLGDVYGMPAPVISLLAIPLGLYLINLSSTDGTAFHRATIVTIAFFGIAAYGNAFFPLELIWSRQILFLVMAVWVAALDWTDRKLVIVALCPLFLVFHVAAAAMFLSAVFIVEAIICLRTRRLTPLLFAAPITVLVALLISKSWREGDKELISFKVSKLIQSKDFLEIIGQSTFQISVLTAIIFFTIAVALLLKPYIHYGLVRASFFLSGAMLGNALSRGIESLSQGTRKLDDGFFVLAHLDQYIVPGLAISALLISVVSLLHRDTETSAPVRGSLNTLRSAVTMAILPLAFLSVMLTLRIDLKAIHANYIYAALDGFHRYTIRDYRSPLFFEKLKNFKLEDDIYYISGRNPSSSPYIYMSALKIQIRSTQGTLDPSKMTFKLGEK
jgi:hypothetical protein